MHVEATRHAVDDLLPDQVIAWIATELHPIASSEMVPYPIPILWCSRFVAEEVIGRVGAAGQLQSRRYM